MRIVAEIPRKYEGNDTITLRATMLILPMHIPIFPDEINKFNRGE
jgi:hypothetical protein